MFFLRLLYKKTFRNKAQCIFQKLNSKKFKTDNPILHGDVFQGDLLHDSINLNKKDEQSYYALRDKLIKVKFLQNFRIRILFREEKAVSFIGLNVELGTSDHRSF